MKKSTTLGLAALIVSTSSAFAVDAVQVQKPDEVEIKRNTVSSAMQEIMEKLEGDYEFIGKFLDNPEAVVSQYDLNPEEAQALSTRNVQDLMNLGYSEEDVTVAMSGTHRGTY